MNPAHAEVADAHVARALEADARTDGDRRLAVLVVLVVALLTAIKVAVAGHLQLFGDEAFYWQCAQRPAPAYADHPFLTAMLVRAGTELLGPTSLGVRLGFLATGVGVVLVLHRLARHVVGRRQALLVALLALTLPGVGLMGIVAVPDAPLLLLSALGLLAVERALRRGELRWWLVGGVVGAVGLATHYRFGLFGLAVGITLLVTARGRRALNGPGPWILAALSLAGLLPVLLFNLELDFVPFRYQFLERHAGEGPGPFQHVLQQLGMATPLLYLVLVGTLVALLRRARQGDEDAAFFGLMALVQLGFWLVTSTFSDDERADAHWPVPGYLPLLVYLPRSLAALSARGRAGRVLALAAPALGGAAVLGALVLGALSSTNVRFVRAFLGWAELREELHARLDGWEGEAPVVVADNYLAAAQVEFALAGADDAATRSLPVYVFDHAINNDEGRALQYELWGRDETSLRALAGRPAFVVVEVTQTKLALRPAWIERLGTFVEPLEFVGKRRIAIGGTEHRPRKFKFYSGRVVAAAAQDG